jgi:hypothetical protein
MKISKALYALLSAGFVSYANANQCVFNCDTAGCGQCIDKTAIDGSAGLFEITLDFSGCKSGSCGDSVSWISCCTDVDCPCGPTTSCEGAIDCGGGNLDTSSKPGKCENVTYAAMFLIDTTKNGTVVNFALHDGNVFGNTLAAAETFGGCGGTGGGVCDDGERPRNEADSHICQWNVDIDVDCPSEPIAQLDDTCGVPTSCTCCPTNPVLPACEAVCALQTPCCDGPNEANCCPVQPGCEEECNSNGPSCCVLDEANCCPVPDEACEEECLTVECPAPDEPEWECEMVCKKSAPPLDCPLLIDRSRRQVAEHPIASTPDFMTVPAKRGRIRGF